MSAYNEINFNKMLEAYSELKSERDSLIMVINNLVTELVDKHGYTNDLVAEVVTRKPEKEVITIQP
jgi:hypothetical protein